MKEPPPASILLVEDNEADVRLMQEVLHEHYSRRVKLTSIGNGSDALTVLNSGAQFDLIVLDINLPGLDGYEVLQRRPAVTAPVVVFSSSWNAQDSRRAFALGACEYIRKPSSYAEYVDVVCGFVSRWGVPKTKASSHSV